MSHRRTPFAVLGLVAAALLLILAPAASAKSRDRNHDRIPDKWEAKHHLSLKVNQAGRDQDHDGMKNLAEFKAGTDPRDADTDNDGVKDGAEDSGSVVSFDGKTLTVKLFRNDKTVEGSVDDQTQVECDEHSASARSGGGDGPGHDGTGSGSGHDSGDDHGDRPSPAGTAQPQAGDDHGDDDQQPQGDDANENENEGSSCSAADLKPGAVVHEAELRTTPDGLHFDEIKLGAAAPTA